MQADEVRFLFAYDRWATRQVLNVLNGLDSGVWTRPDVVGERGLGAILVHHLGASQRWRHGFQQTGESPEPELEPLPTIDQLRERWDAEWARCRCLAADPDRRLRRVRPRGGARVADAGSRGQSRDAAPSGGGGATYPRWPIAG